MPQSMLKPRKPLLLEEEFVDPANGELLAQLSLLGPIRKRKKEKAQAQLVEAQQSLVRLSQQHGEDQAALGQFRQTISEKIAELGSKHIGEPLDKAGLSFWQDSEQDLLRCLFERQAAVKKLAHLLVEQHEEITRLKQLCAETDKQQQRLDLMIDYIKEQA